MNESSPNPDRMRAFVTGRLTWARRSIAVAVLTGLLTSLPAFARETDFAYCTVCHGTAGGGNAAIGAPRLAGLDAWYVERQLRAFTEGWRGGADDDDGGEQMRAVALALRDASATAGAVKYAAALRVDPRRPVLTGNADHGKQLYTACAACHGQQGEGNAALGAPRLAQQNDWYLVRQIDKYLRGLRGVHPQDTTGLQMRAAATATLEDQPAIDDVVAYIGTL
ncbi:MAG: c-type cytochrome [Steroidobacteraceae bacterium]